ncbi:MarR family winged helix-turn-helix transcriptional regulator [Microbacterium sp. NPDC056569]|uniref:MarR family winged helix-turn-helix transcriptional regulator n=1 Tax=Microbacterium sp. NPDC056569 TaxID=3345867 RepID=UPI00366CCA57
MSSSTTTVQFGALSFLARHPGASQQDLSEAMDLDRSTVADIVVRLERQRHIQRERDPHDRRRNRLMLTDLGQEVLTQLTPLVIAEENALAGGLTEAERDQLRTLLKKLLTHSWAIREMTHADCEA